MDNKIKRRIFIASGVGTLIGLPFVLNYFTNQRGKIPQSSYNKQIENYRRKISISMNPMPNSVECEWKINPIENKNVNYISMLEMFLPDSMSKVAQGMPDLFYATEGVIETGRTTEGYPLIAGSDTFSREFYPYDSMERPLQDFLLLLKNDRLVQVSLKEENKKGPANRSFVHLLGMNNVFPHIKAGLSTIIDTGRIRPFKGIRTHYTILGFDKMAELETVHIGFDAKNYNLQKLAGEPGIDPMMKTSQYHHGDAWFDLKTGLLVRQVVDCHSVVTGDLGDDRINKNSVNDFHGLYTIQLFG